MPGIRKSHSRLWVRRTGQCRLAEMSWAGRLMTTGWWVSWHQVQPVLVTHNLNFHWGIAGECHAMVTSMLPIGPVDADFGQRGNWIGGGPSHFWPQWEQPQLQLQAQLQPHHGCHIWWVLHASVMYKTPLDLVNGISVFLGTLMWMSGQQCREVIETCIPAVSMLHL